MFTYVCKNIVNNKEENAYVEDKHISDILQKYQKGLKFT